MKFFQQQIYWDCIILLIYCLIGVFITFPLLFHISNYTTGYGDELLIAWVHAWVQHALVTNPFHLFQANIYFPYPNSLAYSDAFITSSLITWPFIWIFKEPIVANNIVLFYSIVLGGFSIYLLTRYLTGSIWCSFLSGVLVMFSPAFLDKFVHLQVMAIFWLPLSILGLLKYLATRQMRYFYFFLSCFILQTLDSFMAGYFILISAISVVVYYLHQKKLHIKIFLGKKILLSLLIVSCILLPFIQPYLQVSHAFHYVRDLRDTIHYGMQPEDFFSTNNFSRLQPFFQYIWSFEPNAPKGEIKAGFLGGAFTLLSIFSSFFLLLQWKKISIATRAIFIAGLIGLVLSFGPFLHIDRQTIHHPFPIPLPYLLFFYLLPGFQGFRDSSRFEMIFVMLMAVVVGYVLHHVSKRMKKRVVLMSILILFTILEYSFPMHFLPIQKQKDFPPVYHWIAAYTNAQASIIEMPIYNWIMAPYSLEELQREYYSTAHFRNMVNGGSGYSPQPWQDMVTNLLFTFPNKNSLLKLQTLHVDYIIVHVAEYNALHDKKVIIDGHGFDSGSDIITSLEKSQQVSLVTKKGSDYVFRLHDKGTKGI